MTRTDHAYRQGLAAAEPVGVPHDQPARDMCFRCKGTDLAAVKDSDSRVNVLHGVTIQAVHWPPRP